MRGGHPWVYNSSIDEIKPGGDPQREDGDVGDLGVVFDRKRQFAAIGLYDPESPIRLRILHQGSPRQIDDAFWRERLEAALAVRAPLLATGDSSGWRWVSGENDGLPGLVLDCYDRTLVVKLDTGAWFPHLAAVLAQAVDLHPIDAIVLRLSRSVTPPADTFGDGTEGDHGIGLDDGEVLLGDGADEVSFTENGASLTADVIRGQKTGYFLDQRANRRRVGELAAGQHVLDVFSCTGGFTVAAVAGGAASVHAVDRSTHAIASVARHAKLAGDAPVTTAANDAFDELESLAEAKRRFGVVVVDPPSFASSAKDVWGAQQAYRRLTTMAEPLVSPDGWLVQASCTSRVSVDDFVDGVLDALAASGRGVVEHFVTGHDIDHPIGFAQGAYLKCVFARLA